MTPFELEVQQRIASNAEDETLKTNAQAFMSASTIPKYSYNFFWLGRPIIQYPQDMVAMQEIVWSVKPDLIIETGIAHGGSLMLSASMLALLDMADAIEKGASFDPRQSNRKVVGVDIEIRPHNRTAIQAHPMISRIQMIEGSSVDPDVIEQVRHATRGHDRIMVCLDSNHTHDHVLAELKAYAVLVSVGSYCVVFDTGIEDLPEHYYADRPWGKRNNPKTAVLEFLKSHTEFQIDKSIEHKLLITAAPDGYLRRVR
jgi:cephalosporin hydroxylase